MTRALVVAPQWIGDAVMSEPLIAALAQRGEQVSVATLPWVAPVYRAIPQVKEIIEWPLNRGQLNWSARRRIAIGLRGRFDAAYVLPNSWKSALIPFMAGIARRVGYHGEGRWLLLNERLPNPPKLMPMVTFYNRLAGPLSTPNAQPRLQIDRAHVELTCAKAELEPGRYWVFAPGAEFGPSKCWPASHYAALARSLHGAHGLPVVLLGSSKDVELCDGIAQTAPGACRVLAGKTQLFEAMALIAGARGVMSNASGLMHVAAAFAVPQVAAFGSTPPEHAPPLNPNARVLWIKHELNLTCAPCFERTCRFGHTRCLTEITPSSAEAAMVEALKMPLS